MVSTASADVVFFAIQSALKLGGQVREAYMDATRARAITLPLPSYEPSNNHRAALTYFRNLKSSGVELPPGLSKLMQQYADADGELAEDKLKDFLDYYDEYLIKESYQSRDAGTQEGTAVSAESFNHLVTIRQWSRGSEPHPSPLQRVAGTLLEIAVDYYAGDSSIINEHSRDGKILKAVLAGIDEIPFSEIPLGQLPEKLLMATLETVNENTALITSDENLADLIRVTSTALGVDVLKHIEDIRNSSPQGNIAAERRVVEWAEVVFRSLLSSAGRTVVQDPKRYLGIRDAEGTALVANVGNALLDFALSQKPGQLEEVFRLKGLEVVARAAVTTVAKHPELIVDSDQRGLTALVRDIASVVAERADNLDANMIPDLARIVIEKTGENLTLFWPDAEKDPKKNLALVTAQNVLVILSTTSDGQWKPRFDKTEALSIVNAALDEFLDNPQWLIASATDEDKNLGVALGATVAVLRRRGDDRLSTDTATEILQETLKAVALRQEFLSGIDAEERVIVAAAVDIVLGCAFQPDVADGIGKLKVSWQLTRKDNLIALVKISLEELSKCRLSVDCLERLKEVGADQVKLLADGDPWLPDAYRDALHTALNS